MVAVSPFSQTAMTSGPWHLYLLRCRDGSVYAGITTDIERRFREHVAGRGAKYTRSHPPECMLGSRTYPDRASASRAEHVLKRQPKARKLDWLLDTAESASVG